MTDLMLWPAYARDDGVRVGLSSVRRALERYWGDGHGSGLARQGPDYYSPPVEVAQNQDAIEFGDLAWAVLLAGRPIPAAAQALLRRAPIDISVLPSTPLERLGTEGLQRTADIIWRLSGELHGFGIALVVKILHRKRPETIPVIDGLNFFGSYQYPDWRPGRSAKKGWTARRPEHVVRALERVQQVVGDPRNGDAWRELDDWQAPDGRGQFSRIEIFDMLWWAFRHDPRIIVDGDAGS